MTRKSILASVLSNWLHLLARISIAFVVTPILVHQLGNDQYGIWILAVSLTGYFSVLDLGVSTAVVRYISRHVARGEWEQARVVYSTSHLFFLVIGFASLLVFGGLALFFPRFAGSAALTPTYLSAVFLVIGLDVAANLVFSALTGALIGLQEFVKLNFAAIVSLLATNAALIVLLLLGYRLLTLALIQLAGTLLRSASQYLILRRGYPMLRLDPSTASRSVTRQIVTYSSYSFLISIAFKVLFYTDSLVIGSLISVGVIAFYAIASSLVDYLQQSIWAAVRVFLPLASSQEALDDPSANRRLYVDGTRYSLALSLPLVFVLFQAGETFISLWMGNDFSLQAAPVLRILLLGYAFFFSQLTAHAILKGIGRHRALALFLAVEAVANLLLSLALARPLGLAGVAIGTTVPMIVVNLVLVPAYACKRLGLRPGEYFSAAYLRPTTGLVLLLAVSRLVAVELTSYLEIALYALSAVTVYGAWTWGWVLGTNEREQVRRALRPWLARP